LGCAVLALGGGDPSAQQERGAVRLGGKVSPALSLSIGQPWPPSNDQASSSEWRTRVTPAGRDSLQIDLSRTERPGSSPLTIPLQLRTNVGYELKLTPLSAEGCLASLTASIHSVKPSGAMVVSGAAEASHPHGPVELEPSNDAVLLLEGPRISARGNFTSAGNALSLDLRLAPATPPAKDCPGRASLRLSLQPK
jgi:hypothetical protein